MVKTVILGIIFGMILFAGWTASLFSRAILRRPLSNWPPL